MLNINLAVKKGVLFNKQIAVNDSVLSSFPFSQEWNHINENEMQLLGIPTKTNLKNIIIHPSTHAIKIIQKEDDSFWLESTLKDDETPGTNEFVISYK